MSTIHTHALHSATLHSFRGFLWFIAILWPYMAFGLLCSSAAQFLVDQASIGNGAPLDVIDFPDLKSIHGFVGTILGTCQIEERKIYARWMCSYVLVCDASFISHVVSTRQMKTGFTISIRTSSAYDRYYEG